MTTQQVSHELVHASALRVGDLVTDDDPAFPGVWRVIKVSPKSYTINADPHEDGPVVPLRFRIGPSSGIYRVITA